MRIILSSLIRLMVVLWGVGIGSHLAQARIPSVAFKGVTSYFQKGKEFYSPTIGITAIESGLIHNLRFYGNFTSAYDELGHKRLYVNDKANDPVWQVLFILFPSPAGNLAVETTSPHNFGKHVVSPKTVALLLNYVYQIRTKGDYTFPQESIAPLPPAVPAPGGLKSPKPRKQQTAPAKLSITMDGFKESINQGVFQPTQEQLDLLQEYEKKINEQSSVLKKSDLQNIRKFSKISLTPEQIGVHIQHQQAKKTTQSFTSPKPKKQKIDHLAKLTQAIYETLNIQETTYSDNLKQNIKRLLNVIKDALKFEQGSIYPAYSIEQIILAFFCEKFNAQQDIWLLIKGLADLDTDHTLIQHAQTLVLDKGDLFQESDLPHLLSLSMADLDDAYLLANADVFYRITPYKDGVDPVSNGDTHPYNRQTKTLETITFADCIETLMRHICNVLLYNPRTKNFDLSHLQAADPENTSLQNLNAYYQYQTPLLANAGDIKTRSLWNKVVGDLDGVVYFDGKRKFYNMAPGYLNIITAFAKVLPLNINDIDLKTTSLQEAQEWVETSIGLIFKGLNPDYSYSLDTSQLSFANRYNRNERDIFGNIFVDVKDKKGGKLFSFTLNVTPDHGQLTQMKSWVENPYKEQISQAFLSLKEVFQENTSINSLKLLMPLVKQPITELLYRLYPQSLQDNKALISSLKMFALPPEDQSAKDLEVVLEHILEAISWEDLDVLDRISPALERVDPHFSSLLRKYVRGISSDSMTADQVQEALGKYKNIEVISLSQNQNIQELTLKNLPTLKKLILSDSSISRVDGLQTLTSLEELDLGGATDFQELSLRDLENLTTLEVAESSLLKIELENLTSLGELDLADLKDLQELSLKNLPNQKSIDLSGTSPLKITLENLTALKKLDVPETQDLQEMSLVDLPKLSSLNLLDAGFSRLTVKNLISLTDLSLIGAENIQKLSLSGLPNLINLDLSGASVPNGGGFNDLPSLQRLFLIGVENLKELVLMDLVNLAKIDLSESSIRRLGLQNLPSLRKLLLITTPYLRRMYLINLPSLTMLDLSQSSVKMSRINGLNTLPHTKIIR